MLTKKQLEMFRFLKAFYKKKGYMPSYIEIKGETGIRSNSNVHRYLRCLQERGVIKVMSRRARAIKIVGQK